MRFTPCDFDTVAAGLGDAIKRHGYTCYACAIMQDHEHMVVRKHKHDAETMIANLQLESRLRLSDAGVIPADHPAWTKAGWKSFLGSPAAVESVIRYVANNPVKAQLQPQSWEFVTQYDGWPFRTGRNG